MRRKKGKPERSEPEAVNPMDGTERRESEENRLWKGFGESTVFLHCTARLGKRRIGARGGIAYAGGGGYLASSKEAAKGGG